MKNYGRLYSAVYNYKHNVGLRCIYIGENRKNECINNRIKSIYSSLRIEANSLSIGQVRDVINGQLVLGEQKEIQEVKNAYEAYAQISVINPYDIEG